MEKKNLQQLNEEQLEQVTGGVVPGLRGKSSGVASGLSGKPSDELTVTEPDAFTHPEFSVDE